MGSVINHYAVGDRQHMPVYLEEEEVCRGRADPDYHLGSKGQWIPCRVHQTP